MPGGAVEVLLHGCSDPVNRAAGGLLRRVRDLYDLSRRLDDGSACFFVGPGDFRAGSISGFIGTKARRAEELLPRYQCGAPLFLADAVGVTRPSYPDCGRDRSGGFQADRGAPAATLDRSVRAYPQGG